MILVSIIVLFFTANLSGVFEDDLVPLGAGNLPVVWDVGTTPIFMNSKHLRGVASVKDMKILGLDTVITSLQFSPVDMTIYGNLTGRRIEFVGSYSNNLDYTHEGLETPIHGDGEFRIILTNFDLRKIVAPLRYSRKMKTLQIDDMQYEVHQKEFEPIVTGMKVDGEGSHVMDIEELASIDQANSFPSCIEFIRALVNARAPKWLLSKAAKQVFENALSL